MKNNDTIRERPPVEIRPPEHQPIADKEERERVLEQQRREEQSTTAKLRGLEAKLAERPVVSDLEVGHALREKLEALEEKAGISADGKSLLNLHEKIDRHIALLTAAQDQIIADLITAFPGRDSKIFKEASDRIGFVINYWQRFRTEHDFEEPHPDWVQTDLQKAA